MAQRKISHITVHGHPLCSCGYWADKLMADLKITCGYKSISDAKRAKLLLQKHQDGVAVVASPCPKAT